MICKTTNLSTFRENGASADFELELKSTEQIFASFILDLRIDYRLVLFLFHFYGYSVKFPNAIIKINSFPMGSCYLGFADDVATSRVHRVIIRLYKN